MKVSLAWLFEHIDGDKHAVAIASLVDAFNQKIAEIGSYEHKELDQSLLSIVHVQMVNGAIATCYCAEHGNSMELPARHDLQVGDYALVYRDGSDYRWAKLADMASSKDGYMSAVHCPECLVGGAWRKGVIWDDYILDIDNKSITHRPDMWCHRGVAREIAALLSLPLLPIDMFIKHIDSATNSGRETAYTVSIQDSSICKRYASTTATVPYHQATEVAMGFKLAALDYRPIDALVDSTNYVMADIGQPMHVFDGDTLPAKTIVTRFAHPGEKLALLDGTTVTLSEHDYVITDGHTPIALAGIMGGQATAVSRATRNIFVEAACFDAGVLRKTTAHLHLRTESSARFEKSIDATLAPLALQRLAQVWDDMGLEVTLTSGLAIIGDAPQAQIVMLNHDFLERRLGLPVSKDFVIETLTKLGFTVTVDDEGTSGSTQYVVTVPSFRNSKELCIQEDFIEEIGRYSGYTTIPAELPMRSMGPIDTTVITRTRRIKNILAYAGAMQEVANYPLFDESLLRELCWEPASSVSIKNPMSENWRRMVTTLVPGLFKNIVTNVTSSPVLNFFEMARVWHNEEPLREQGIVAGIFFDQKKPVDFYACKAQLENLFTLLHMSVTWHVMERPEFPWLTPYQAAHIIHEGLKIGYVGVVEKTELAKIAPGYACVFELDSDFLVSYQPPRMQFVPLPKYPSIDRDISFMAPLAMTAESVIASLSSLDKLIQSITLVDFFTKKEWVGRRSLTLRIRFQSNDRTLTTAEVDAIMPRIIDRLVSLGVELR